MTPVPESAVLLLAVLVFAVRPVAAQTIRGSVLEDGTRRPVVGADVVLTHEGGREGLEPLRTATDTLGYFAVPVPAEGSYVLRVTHVAYLDHEGRDVYVGADEIVTVEVRMSSSAIPLEPLVVTARSRSPLAEFEERRHRGGFGRFLVRADLEARGAQRTTDLFRGFSGVTVRTVRGGRSDLVYMRSGLGLCMPSIWVDGVRVQQSVASNLDDVVSPDLIEGVEVYDSAAEAPVQYVQEPCGVVLIWTRRGSARDGAPWDWKKIVGGAGAAVALIFLFVR